MTSINNNQRSTRSSSPAPGSNTTSNTTGASGTSTAPQTSSTSEPDLNAEDFGSFEPENADNITSAEATLHNERSAAAAATAKDKLSGTFVTDGDVAAALKGFEGLTIGERRAAFEVMQRDGSFTTLLKEADGDERRRLTDMMLNAGMLPSTTPAAPHKNGPLGPEPPAAPSFPIPPKDASPEMKAMLHDENIARAQSYAKAHGEYVLEYREAIREAPNFRAFRQIGEAAEPATLPLHEPGTAKTDQITAWSTATRREPDTQTGKVITAKMYQLRGEIPPGVDSDITAKAKLAFSESVAISAGASYGEDRYGNSSASASASADVAIGPETAQVLGNGTVGVAAKNGKVTDVTATGSASFGTGKTRDKKNDAGEDVKDGGTSGLTSDGGFKADGAIGVASGSIELSKGKAAAEAEILSVKGGLAYEEGKSATATVGAAGISATVGVVEGGGMLAALEAKKKLAIAGVKVEIQVGIKQTVQLATVQDFERFTAVIENGPFETPGELTRGVKWDALSHGAREAYTLYGWTKESWAEAQTTARATANIQALRAGGGR